MKGHAVTVSFSSEFSDDLRNRVLVWKEERNRLIHALLKQQLTEEDVPCIASEGSDLVRALRTGSAAYNKARKQA